MFQFILIIHLIICFILVLIILFQKGLGSQLGATFGGIGQANQIKTPETFMGKFTTIVAIFFIVTSITLAILSSNQSSILEKDSSETIQDL